MKITKVLSNLITEDARFQVLYKKYVLPSGDRKKGILPFEIVRDIVFADPTTRPQDYDVASASVQDMTSDQVKVGKYAHSLRTKIFKYFLYIFLYRVYYILRRTNQAKKNSVIF